MIVKVAYSPTVPLSSFVVTFYHYPTTTDGFDKYTTVMNSSKVELFFIFMFLIVALQVERC